MAQPSVQTLGRTVISGRVSTDMFLQLLPSWLACLLCIKLISELSLLKNVLFLLA